MKTSNNIHLCDLCFSEKSAKTAKCPHCEDIPNIKNCPTALKEGAILMGQYLVGKLLGKGGFGITYLCYDLKNNKKVAIKEFFPDSFAHRNAGDSIVTTYADEKGQHFKDGVQKFYEEAKIVSRFNGNPNIISVHKFFYENNTSYLVMEYLEGCDLRDYIKSNGKKISEEQAIYILHKVLDALTIIHSTDILHRDIKPDNIYICEDGNIKLFDFGAARQVIGEASKSLSVILTQGFAPLEQYQKKGKQGPWTDIYALGATIYYALTGIVIDDAMSRLDDDSVDMKGFSEGFAGIIRKMISVQAANRYQSTFEIKTDLAKLKLTPVPPIIPAKPEPVQGETKQKSEIHTETAVNQKRKIPVWSVIASSVAAVAVIVATIAGISHTGEDRNYVNVDGNGWEENSDNNSGEGLNGTDVTVPDESQNGVIFDGENNDVNGEAEADAEVSEEPNAGEDLPIADTAVQNEPQSVDTPNNQSTPVTPPAAQNTPPAAQNTPPAAQNTSPKPSTPANTGNNTPANQNAQEKPSTPPVQENNGAYSNVEVYVMPYNSGGSYSGNNGSGNSAGSGYTAPQNVPQNTGLSSPKKCGENATCTLSSYGTLTISGTGGIDNYTDSTKRPWDSEKDKILKVVIENGITNVGERAFIQCTNLTEVSIPSSVRIIEDNAFYGCSSLNKVNFPSGLWQIEPGAFENCRSLKSVQFPEGLLCIGSKAFYCSGLQGSISIPSTVKIMGYNVFSNTSLSEIYVNTPSNERTDWQKMWRADCDAKIVYA